MVDDNATNRTILQEMLSGWEMRPECVASAREALETLADAARSGRPFALGIVDVLMPEVDGFTLVERIHGTPGLERLKILILTSGGQRGDAARCRALGVSAYLPKPARQSDLFNAIQQVLGGAAAGPEATTGSAATDARVTGASGRKTTAGPAPLVTRHSLRETRRGLRVLLVDDNAINRMVSTNLLLRRGHTVVAATNGLEGLAAIEREPFDLVLMDVHMPEMDGLQATARIRERERGTGRRLPIIGLTARAMKGDREAGLAAGMDAYVTKPVRWPELFEAIQRVTGARAALVVPPAAEGGSAGPRPSEILDRARILSEVEGDYNLLRRLVEAFRDQARSLLREGRAAAARADAPALGSAAHALKSVVGHFTTGGLVAQLEGIEARARGGDARGSRAAWKRVEGEVGRLRAALGDLAKGA